MNQQVDFIKLLLKLCEANLFAFAFKNSKLNYKIFAFNDLKTIIRISLSRSEVI